MTTSVEEAIKWLTTIHVPATYNLENMEKLLDIFSHPEKSLEVIHITGTNGKGSVARMTYQILRDAGYNVGLFIGPHLIDVRERFIVNDEQIDDENLIDIVQKLERLDFIPTRFEKYVITMLLYFYRKEVDCAIVEVGMGARRDATIIVEPILSVITSIGIDHPKQLGSTIEEVAKEKSYIIKPKVPVILFEENPVLIERAKKQESPYIVAKKEYKTNLLGPMQRKNAGIAYEVGKFLEIPDSEILNSLEKVNHKGRLEYITENLLIDVAHNPQSVQSLKTYIDSINIGFEEIYYCFSIKKGKDPSFVMDILGRDKKYIVIQVSDGQLESSDTLHTNLGEGNNIEKHTPKDIIKRSQKNTKQLFVVFGSLYVLKYFIPS